MHKLVSGSDTCYATCTNNVPPLWHIHVSGNLFLPVSPSTVESLTMLHVCHSCSFKWSMSPRFRPHSGGTDPSDIPIFLCYLPLVYIYYILYLLRFMIIHLFVF
jgi:hypothetical protein